jgi:putative Mg2+ transporter-C (MgtC) family protein
MIQEYMLKLLLASIVGIVVGAERASKHKNVGPGTCSLITLASTLLTILSYEMTAGDPSRLVANIITSVGFLCGGVIFVRSTDKQDDNADEVVGLTTGAILFCLAAVGIAIGLGYYALTVISTAFILVNILISKMFKRAINHDIKTEELEEKKEA